VLDQVRLQEDRNHVLRVEFREGSRESSRAARNVNHLPIFYDTAITTIRLATAVSTSEKSSTTGIGFR
jgi:hypothetical protein